MLIPLFKREDRIFNVGILEMAIAMYPILAGYSYGSFRLAFVFLLIVDVCLIGLKVHTLMSFKPIYRYLVFIVLHNILWIFVMSSIPNYFLNSFLVDIIYLCSIPLIVPHIDFDKLRKSIYIVAVVCLAGMLYHVILIRSGQSIQPIKLPFMPDMGSETRLYSYLDRPTSFFWEPQSYSSFMLVPLFLLLREKKMISAFIVAASMMLSTSTTGILMALFMIGFFLLTQKQNMKYRIFTIISVVGLVLFLLYSSSTSVGLNKLQNTDIEESNRIINGFLIAKNMNFIDMLFGVPFANLQDAYEAGYITRDLIIHDDGVVFVSAFWICLCCQGIIGLFFFMSIYWNIYKNDRSILPYLICIIISLFSNPDILGASYVFQLMVMYSFISYNKQNK